MIFLLYLCSTEKDYSLLKLKSYEDTDDENDGMDADTGWHDEPYFLRSGV
jgi:hypothetical protein